MSSDQVYSKIENKLIRTKINPIKYTINSDHITRKNPLKSKLKKVRSRSKISLPAQTISL